MNNVEYVARVVVERVERRVVTRPPGTRTTPSRDRIVCDRTEVASFTIRDGDLANLAMRVTQVLPAALPDTSVRGEETNIDVDDEEEDDA